MHPKRLHFRINYDLQLPSNVDTTFETNFDQTSNTIDTNADESKMDDTANETNGDDDDNDDIDDGIDISEVDANSTVDQTEPSKLVKIAKPETLQKLDDNGSAPRAPAPTASTPAAAVKAAENKSEDKNISRSGRVIKRTKYLLDELEESPTGQTMKRKRPLDSPATVQKRRKSDEGSGENGAKITTVHKKNQFDFSFFFSFQFNQNRSKYTTVVVYLKLKICCSNTIWISRRAFNCHRPIQRNV